MSDLFPNVTSDEIDPEAAAEDVRVKEFFKSVLSPRQEKNIGILQINS